MIDIMVRMNQPNVLFLLSDEHSYRCFSHLESSGEGEPVSTPTWDELAEQSCVFHTAYAQVPVCTPSRICMLAGTDPMRSGGWGNGSMMREGIATLPGALVEAGYATCLIGKMHLGGDRQFVGFQHRPYGDLTGGTGHQWEPLHRRGGRALADRTADVGVTEIPESALQEAKVNQETAAWIREHEHARPDQPWMVLASYSRPHFPLTAPKRYIDRYPPEKVPEPKVGRTGDTADHPMTRGMVEGFQTERIDRETMMRARGAYFACVDYLDEILGDLFAVLEREGLLDNTIIVYTSDHGELAGEHGLWWKNSWHEAAARVPLMISLPEHRRGDLPAVRLHTPVSLADLFPTLCGLCGAKAPAGLDGVDLSQAIRRGAEPERGAVFFDNPTPRWGEGCEHRVVREGRYKYVAFRGESVADLLFDLQADPLEQHNLADAADHAERAARMRELVDATWDFAAAEKQRGRDEQLTKQRKLPQIAGNVYHMPGGPIVDADLALYEPKVLTDDPAGFYSDWPGDRSRG